MLSVVAIVSFYISPFIISVLGFYRPETDDRALQPRGKAGDHRHRDARVHDQVRNDANEVDRDDIFWNILVTRQL